MLVRRAVLDDLEQLVDIGEIFQIESPLHGLQEFDREKTKRFATHMISGKDQCAFLAETNDRIHGFIAGGLRSMYYSEDKYLSEYVYYVTQDSRGSYAAKGLLDAFYDWGKENGAKAIQVGISTAIDPKRADRFMTKMGFNYMGANFYKEVK
jgi:GNAT superfamily N-acetyltransferase